MHVQTFTHALFMQVFTRVISELKIYYFTHVRLLMRALHNTAYLMVSQYEAMLEAAGVSVYHFL